MSFLDPIGKFLEDVIAPIGDVYTSLRDSTLPLLKGLPGAGLVEDAVNQGADWVKGVVNLPGADIVLKSMAMLTYGPIAHALGGTAWFGPQIASAVWALPGVVHGEDAFKAWAFEVKDRFEKLAVIYGSDIVKDQLRNIVPDALRWLNREASFRFPDLPLAESLRRLGQVGITPEVLAEKMKIGVIVNGRVVYRSDIAAVILNGLGDARPYNVDEFDLTTGQRVSPLGTDYVPLPSRSLAAEAASLLQAARKEHLPGGISVGDIAELIKHPPPTTSTSTSSRLQAPTLFDNAADGVLLTAAAAGLYLFVRNFWKSPRRSRRRVA